MDTDNDAETDTGSNASRPAHPRFDPRRPEAPRPDPPRPDAPRPGPDRPRPQPPRPDRPRSGHPVRGSTTGRPIMAALDLLGRRWTLRLLWELRAETLGFRELQRRCEQMSSSVLSARLGDLTAAGIVQTDDAGYHLTPLGKDLIQALGPLQKWADEWAAVSPPGETRSR